MEQIIGVIIIAIISSAIGYIVSKKITNAKFDIYTEQAKAKAKVIEFEANNILKEAKINARKEFEKEFKNARRKIEDKEIEINTHLQEELDSIKKDRLISTNEKNKTESLNKGLIAQESEYKSKLSNVLKVLENVSGLTQTEAKEQMINFVKEESRSQIASIFRKEYKQAQKNSKQEIQNILSHAVTRYAGEFAAERLTNNIPLPSEEAKGKIIGKEGRNIKALEMCLGVDIIIGDIPNTVTISSFNLYRRAIATKTLEELLSDGRIQPARIEEVYERVKKEFDDGVNKEGEEILEELGIKEMHKDLIRLVGRLRYRASYGQNALAHTLEVANLAGLIASQLGGDTVKARRAGLLHDIGKALTHEMKGSHVDIGADLCKKLGEPSEVINAIYAHHGHEDASSIESAAVCAADALSAARPGARREVLQSFLQRVEDIETIATSHTGVVNAYAINAGREIRVIVNAKLVNDDESILLASTIAQSIEDKVQYPGEIKVNVIRELRASGYAR
ncbi:MAG TPA: ribonuclease Y [Arcobacter sp.]|nr:ribonuclease Y [Arcobacter sp.]HIP56105.1 ribonuclease Y [Arcobacter sp.]